MHKRVFLILLAVVFAQETKAAPPIPPVSYGGAANARAVIPKRNKDKRPDTKEHHNCSVVIGNTENSRSAFSNTHVEIGDVNINCRY